MVQNWDDLIEDDTLPKMWNDITFKISFCMSADEYLSVFLFIRASILRSSSARSLSSCVRLELELSPCLRGEALSNKKTNTGQDLQKTLSTLQLLLVLRRETLSDI